MAGWAAFCAASWQARNEFVGWSADARVANLRRMVNNYRFLPGVRVHGLASRVLDLAATRLPGDWEAAYGLHPLMAYTYVSLDHSGTCYRKAGWERCDRPTSGAPPGAAAKGAVRSVEAAGRRLEGAAVQRAGTGDRLCPGGTGRLGGTGVRSRNAPGRTHPAAHGGACVGGTSGPAGADDLPGETGLDSGKSTPVESEGDPHSRIPQGVHGRALPQGARGSGGPGHDDAELQRAGSHVRPGAARRRRVGNQRHRRPLRACDHDLKTPARGLRDQRHHARRQGRERERPLATSTRRRRLRAPVPTRRS